MNDIGFAGRIISGMKETQYHSWTGRLVGIPPQTKENEMLHLVTEDIEDIKARRDFSHL